ncbi:argininosuccinate lyase [Candidatus Sulfidibacterium hydrothermale]|uniref:argininosuccinate lyase n=1 Tax=Candidatus Sulfidibacterium hydrothermale TaxID=2875962 RepID=UPI001F0ABA11|nr:argininosuccinate lyase [Candidatus Sulfidibacterium hydrothermale]UBM61409.1 argininosuccinate lyase [Candidatus Sulfidibacterium hydrothermale]
MKLWDKGYTTAEKVEKFTVGNDRILDLKLAKYDVEASRAHAEMLEKTGLLTKDELQALQKGLDAIAQSIENGTFTIEENFEDVHSKIEFELTRTAGEAGKKIHTARSRNDQVLVALQLYLKDEITTIKEAVRQLFHQLIALSEKNKAVLLPGYTHTQIAMPSSFGMWFAAYAEILIDDILLFNAAYAVADQNPLGSAAGYGSSFPVNRRETTQKLGFNTLKYNSIAAQLSRGKVEKTTAYALASLSGTLSKMASDMILFLSGNFNFIHFPKELTTGSSIMPHKQNPDVLELIRAKSNKLQNLPAEIILIVNNLISGYHRDFQLLKESIVQGIDQVKENLEMFSFMLEHIEVNQHILDDEKYKFLYTVESVNKLVQQGKSFREAYQIVGKKVLDGSYIPDRDIHHTHEGSIGNLCNNEIVKKFNRFYSLP